ncbi:MAG: hypothetical protein HJJLKODD_01908 [Phycisphaerae bacterium]|nr:hypothetical protein [Phycisphaerae bacterium]
MIGLHVGDRIGLVISVFYVGYTMRIGILISVFTIGAIGCSGNTQLPAGNGNNQFAPSTGCVIDSDCDDHDPCTLDTCSQLHDPEAADFCRNDPLKCDTPGFVCDSSTGDCICDDDTDCDDNLFCTGPETCTDGQCVVDDPPCDLPEFCDEPTNSCLECHEDFDCDDGVYCNGIEECAQGTCESAASSPCADYEECDEALMECVLPVSIIQNATWLVYAYSDWTVFTATAFGVDSNLFATNAHVTQALIDLFTEPGAAAWLIQNETGYYRSIDQVWTHPQFIDGQPGPDVGLIHITGAAGIFLPLQLASTDTLQSLHVFDEVSLCGFPGDIVTTIDLTGDPNGAWRPRTTCLQGTISALRPFDSSDMATPANTQLVQYDLPTSPGTSGSAVFNDLGEVIGINSSGIVGQGDYNFAIRADVLQQLMDWKSSGAVEPVTLTDVEIDVPPCQTSWYNDDWQFGFDLPSGFDTLITLDSDVLYNQGWVKTSMPQGYVGTRVLSGSALDSAWISIMNSNLENQCEIIYTEIIYSSNGVPAYYGEFICPDPNSDFPDDDFYEYYLITQGVYGLYDIEGGTRLYMLDDIADTLEAAVRSLCTDYD